MPGQCWTQAGRRPADCREAQRSHFSGMPEASPKLIAPKGQADSQAPQARQSSASNSTSPEPLFARALTGQAETQAGSSHCWQSTGTKARPWGEPASAMALPFLASSTFTRPVPGSRFFLERAGYFAGSATPASIQIYNEEGFIGHRRPSLFDISIPSWAPCRCLRRSVPSPRPY